MRGCTRIEYSAVVFMLGALFTLAAMPAVADVPGLINLQGRLTDGTGTIVPNGSYPVTFRIYDNAGPGGTVLWSEITSVTTSGGLFTKLMGSVMPIPDSVFNNPDRWLGIQVTGNGEMFPRTQLSSVGSALVAQWNSSGQDIYRTTGNVGIGTTAPAHRLHVYQETQIGGTNGMFISSPLFPGIQLDARSNASGGAIGSCKLVYNSTPNGYGAGSLAGAMLLQSDNAVQFSTGGDNVRMTVDANGHVGIGTSSPVYQLDVNSSTIAVRATSTGSNTSGVFGISNGGANGVGILGSNVSGFAGKFFGDVDVDGTLSKNAGAFKIDHPLDPANKYLSHSFVESPDMMNIYNGNIVTDAQGNATVKMPDWFGALNKDFRYQLTVIGQFAQAIVSDEIEGNQFSIKTDKPKVKVSWQVTGIRQDAYANAHRIPVEELKPSAERGFYRNPELFSQPEEKGTEWARHPEMMKQMKDEREKAEAELEK